MRGKFEIRPMKVLGNLREGGFGPIEGATWYVAEEVGDGLVYYFPRGALAGMNRLTADMLLGGKFLVVFMLSLQEGENGSTFCMVFGALN